MASPYKRGYNFEQVAYLLAPTAGLNTDANPWELPQDQAPLLTDFILRPGKIVMRGQIYTQANLAAGAVLTTPYSMAGGFIVDSTTPGANPSGNLIMSTYLNSATLRTEHRYAPLVGAAAATLTDAKLEVAQVSLDGTSAISHNVGGTADQTVGGRAINFDGLMYAISLSSAGAVATDVNGNYHVRPLSLVTYPATTASAGPPPLPTVLANAPHGAFDLKGYLQRIWLLGGIDTPGGFASHEPVTLYYTNTGTSGVGTASADWRNPVSGFTNKAKMDNNNSDFGVGLGVAPSGLVVFRWNSVWVLRGQTSDSFQLQPISKTVGCVDPRTIVETDRGIYFLSRKGLMFTDGSLVRDVTGEIGVQFRGLLTQYFSANGPQLYGAWARSALMSEGQILVTIGSYAPGGTTNWRPKGIWSGIYDPARQAWVNLSSGFWFEPAGGVVCGALDGVCFGPAMPLVARPDRGQIFTVGAAALAVVENIAAASLLRTILDPSAGSAYDPDIANVFGTDVRIPSMWQTRLVPMSAGDHRSNILRRIVLDFLFRVDSNPPANGWRITADDVGTHNKNIGQTSTPTVNTSFSGTTNISRYPWIIYSEADDIMLTVDFGTNPSGNRSLQLTAEIYGIGLSYQKTYHTLN